MLSTLCFCIDVYRLTKVCFMESHSTKRLTMTVLFVHLCDIICMWQNNKCTHNVTRLLRKVTSQMLTSVCSSSLLITFLKSIKSLHSCVPFSFLLIKWFFFLLFVDTDNVINSILGAHHCTLHQSLAMYSSLQLA